MQANWYKAEQYCRFHGMHLASINSGDEQKNLEEHIQSFGKNSILGKLCMGEWNFDHLNWYFFHTLLKVNSVEKIQES